MGHEVLAAYYLALKSGKPRKQAFTSAFELLTTPAIEEKYGSDAINAVSVLFTQYTVKYADEMTDWDVATVEDTLSVPIDEEIEFKFTPDLLVQLKIDLHVTLASGAFKSLPAGSYVLIDHKYSSRAFTAAEVNMNAQLPKYIYGLRRLGYDVSGACFNQINYTSGSREPFVRTWIAPESSRIDAFVAEFIKAARRIAANRKLPVAEYKKLAERSFSKMHCPSCPFRVPCSVDLNGGDVSRILATEYTENSYAIERAI